jgi:hypothetical protein
MSRESCGDVGVRSGLGDYGCRSTWRHPATLVSGFVGGAREARAYRDFNVSAEVGPGLALAVEGDAGHDESDAGHLDPRGDLGQNDDADDGRRRGQE